MRVSAVHPRDQTWEITSPTYRVSSSPARRLTSTNWPMPMSTRHSPGSSGNAGIVLIGAVRLRALRLERPVIRLAGRIRTRQGRTLRAEPLLAVSLVASSGGGVTNRRRMRSRLHDAARRRPRRRCRLSMPRRLGPTVSGHCNRRRYRAHPPCCGGTVFRSIRRGPLVLLGVCAVALPLAFAVPTAASAQSAAGDWTPIEHAHPPTRTPTSTTRGPTAPTCGRLATARSGSPARSSTERGSSAAAS